jgi:ankyrin repeat protein
MNYGFDLRYFNIHAPKTSRLSIFRSPPKSDPVEDRAVCWTVNHGELTALRMLLERGCSPSPKQDGIGTVILPAEAKRWDIVTLLIKSGEDIQDGYVSRLSESEAMKSDIEAVYSGAMGLVHVAAMRNDTEVLTLLLDMGTDVDVRVKPAKRVRVNRSYDPKLQRREQFSWTALHLATETCSLEAAELLSRGANVSQTTLRGDTALHLAMCHSTIVSQETNMVELAGVVWSVCQ